MKAEKILPGKGRALKVALVRHGDLYRVYVLKSNYSQGDHRQAWFVVSRTVPGVDLATAEKILKARAAPGAF